MLNNTGRVAVVTGGSGGIGRACVERLAADGFSVLIHFAGAEDRAEETASALTRNPAADPHLRAYAASKGAVEALTLILARELRGRDITVNAVAPGPTASPLFFKGESQEAVDQIANANPMQRLGTPEDIAETVSFLAGPARWVNGQVLHTNGAMA